MCCSKGDPSFVEPDKGDKAVAIIPASSISDCDGDTGSDEGITLGVMGGVRGFVVELYKGSDGCETNSCLSALGRAMVGMRETLERGEQGLWMCLYRGEGKRVVDVVQITSLWPSFH